MARSVGAVLGDGRSTVDRSGLSRGVHGTDAKTCGHRPVALWLTFCTRERRWSRQCLTVNMGPWRWSAARSTGWTAWRIHANHRRFELPQLVPAANTGFDRSRISRVSEGVPPGAPSLRVRGRIGFDGPSEVVAFIKIS
jgi:hypothetical protein